MTAGLSARADAIEDEVATLARRADASHIVRVGTAYVCQLGDLVQFGDVLDAGRVPADRAGQVAAELSACVEAPCSAVPLVDALRAELAAAQRALARLQTAYSTGDAGMTQAVKPGDLVHYHPIIGEAHTGKVYIVRHVGEIPSSADPVAWLEGKAGCVSMESLSPAKSVEGRA